MNPHAVTLGEEGVARSGDGEPEPLTTPIRFQGRLTPKQIKLSSRQMLYVPMPFHVAFWCFALTVGPFIVLQAIFALQQPSETLPLVLVVVGLLVFTAYWLLPFFHCFYALGAGGRRTRRLIARDAETRGWMSDSGVTVWTPTTAMQCDWEHFAPAVLFPERIQLANCMDDRLRFVLGWQMFDSPVSFQRARKFFIDRDRFATKPDDPVQQAEKERLRLEKRSVTFNSRSISILTTSIGRRTSFHLMGKRSPVPYSRFI